MDVNKTNQIYISLSHCTSQYENSPLYMQTLINGLEVRLIFMTCTPMPATQLYLSHKHTHTHTQTIVSKIPNITIYKYNTIIICMMPTI